MGYRLPDQNLVFYRNPSAEVHRSQADGEGAVGPGRLPAAPLLWPGVPPLGDERTALPGGEHEARIGSLPTVSDPA